MSKNIANVDITIDSWGDLISKLNNAIEVIRDEAITANATYANTGSPSVHKNAHLYGQFVANTITVATALRGGSNTSTTSNLNITSNATFSGAAINAVSNVAITAANVQINSNSSVVAVKVTGNSTATNTFIGGTDFNVNANAAYNANVTVAGQTSFGNVVTFQTELVNQVVSNTDIGTGLTGKVIYTFAKATYATAKLLIQVTNTGNNQLSEAVIAHDGTTAEITTYATVASPAGGNSTPLGTFSANINGSSCELVFNQAANNSAVKVIAQLIKG